MRVMVAVSNWPTHWFSLVPLMQALTRARHDVLVVCDPAQGPAVEALGIDCAPVLTNVDMSVTTRVSVLRTALDGAWPHDWLPPHPITGTPLATLDGLDAQWWSEQIEQPLAFPTARSLDSAVTIARRFQPDVVLHDPASLEGPLAAHALGVPSVLGLWGPTGTLEDDATRILPHDTTGAFERHDLEPFGPWSIGHVIDPCPRALAPRTDAERIEAAFVPYHGAWRTPDVLPRVSARPRVCLSWSTALRDVLGPQTNLLPRLAAVLGAADVDLVITGTAADIASLGDLPARTQVYERCPLSALAPECDLVVHHGGAGTAMTSLWAGVPQLAITFAAEQAATGTRVAAAGAGGHLGAHEADDDRVLAEVLHLASPGPHRAVARRLRSELAQRPAPAEVARAVTGVRAPAGV